MKQDVGGNGLSQVPVVIGGEASVINLDGITEEQIKLSGNVLADFYG